MENSELITRVKAGDRDAFNELYGIYWASLVNYAGLIVDDEAAEDVVQDVFVRVWTQRSKLHDTDSLRSYLLRAVYNTALNTLKKRSHDTDYRTYAARQIEQSCYRHYDPDNSEIIRKLYSKELAAAIDEAIDTLPPKCREVFRLSHIDGLTDREIGARLGISLSTVENHIYHALKRLRQKLSDYKFLILLTVYIFNR